MDIPKGFRLDPNSGLYYSERQAKDSVTGALVRLVTWFDPKSGTSRQTSYPIVRTEPSQPKTIQPTHVSAAPIPQGNPAPIPDGFTLDPQSKLYFRSEKGMDNTGAPVQRVTYYDPGKKSYHHVDYPIQPTATAQGARPLPAPPEPPPDFSDVPTMLGQENNRSANQKKSAVHIIAICASILLVTVLGVCAWQFEWFAGKDPAAPIGSTPSAAPSMPVDTGPSSSEPELTVRSDELASSYAYEKILSGEIIELFFPDGQNFELRYDHNGRNQVVTGTYTLKDGVITLSAQQTASGWSDGSSFSMQKFRRLRYEGPENIGTFVPGMVLKPSDGTGELTEEQQAELEQDAQAAKDAAALERESNSFVGTFVCSDPSIPEELRPAFTIDGKTNLCTVSFNFDNKMLHGTYTYYWEKGSDIISIYLSSFEDATHPARDLPNPKIKIIDEDTLEFLSDDFGNMGSGEYKNIFVKQ